jgi:SET domain-containing protein
VRAGRKILAGELIESAPVVVVPAGEWQVLADTDLDSYLEAWPSGAGEAALPLGFASMYREDADPNARVVKRLETMVMEISAVRDIDEGEEITVPRRETRAG